MKKLLCILGLLVGCGGGSGGGDATSSSESETSVLTSDFTPPTGAGTGGDTENMGPWGNRLLLATSKDGLTWTRKNQLLTDQGDVPDLVMDSQGWIYLYYMGWTVGDEQNKPVVAISTDQGETWVYKKVVLSGFENMSPPCDPDVQLLPDGTYRLYTTTSNLGETPGTYVAEGTDGIHFSKVGSAFSRTGTNVLDPSTVHANGVWHLFAGGQTTTPGANWHATSTDGLTFTYYEEKIFAYQGTRCMVANAIPVSGGWRYYAFTTPVGSIVSFFSSDGWTWTEEAGVRLELDTTTGLEKDSVKDPGVVQLPDGTYLMVYVTQIP